MVLCSHLRALWYLYNVEWLVSPRATPWTVGAVGHFLFSGSLAPTAVEVGADCLFGGSGAGGGGGGVDSGGDGGTRALRLLATRRVRLADVVLHSFFGSP